MTQRAVILFTGDPKREELQKGLPAGFLSILHRDLTRAVHATEGLTLLLATDSRNRFSVSFAERHAEITTCALGEKIDAAFRFAFNLGFESVVLLADDVAGVGPEILSDAFQRLEGMGLRSVLGPSRDGGFYLVGLNRSAFNARIDWNTIPWFTGGVTAALTGSLTSLGCEPAFVQPIDDIDSRNDALRVSKRLSLRFALLRLRLRSILSLSSFHQEQESSWFPADQHPVPSLRAPPLS